MPPKATSWRVLKRWMHWQKLSSKTRVSPPGTQWCEESQQALLALAGVENLEERMVEAGKLDPVVLEYLERKFGM